MSRPRRIDQWDTGGVLSRHSSPPSLDDEVSWERRRRVSRVIAIAIVVTVCALALAAGIVGLLNRQREYHPVIDCVAGYHQSGDHCTKD